MLKCLVETKPKPSVFFPGAIVAVSWGAVLPTLFSCCLSPWASRDHFLGRGNFIFDSPVYFFNFNCEYKDNIVAGWFEGWQVHQKLQNTSNHFLCNPPSRQRVVDFCAQSLCVWDFLLRQIKAVMCVEQSTAQGCWHQMEQACFWWSGLELLRITMTVFIPAYNKIFMPLQLNQKTPEPFKCSNASNVSAFNCSSSFSGAYFLIYPLYIVCHSCIYSRLVDSATAISPADDSIEVRDVIFLTSQRSTRISLHQK